MAWLPAAAWRLLGAGWAAELRRLHIAVCGLIQKSAAKGQKVASPSDSIETGEVVEQSPLRTTFLRSHNRFVLSWPNDSTLEIKYHRGVRIVAWFFCVLGWPVLLLGLMGVVGQLRKPEAADSLAVGLLLVWGGTFGFLGLWLLGPRIRFDASNGWLTVRHFWRTRRQRLSQIMAVQVIDAGWFGNRASDSDTTAVKFRSFQLNLVLDDPDEPRMFVAYNHDLNDMARKARILADFLGVPLLGAPQVQELARIYSEQDAQRPPGASKVGRFRGNDALRPVPDRRLPEPYGAWIDGTQTLPSRVRLLPRTVSILYDLSLFLPISFTCISMVVLVALMFGPPLMAGGQWTPIVFLGGVCFLLVLIPWYLLRRLSHTIVAWRRFRRGTLREGIFVGPEGVLVRMEPNRCYAIALDRFVNARVDEGILPATRWSDQQQRPDFVIETLDGPVAFHLDRMSDPPEKLNQWVAELRS